MNKTGFTREIIAEEVSKICYAIDNTFQNLKDYKPQTSGVIVPFSLLCKLPADGMLNCLNEFMQVSEYYKLDEDDAINYGLLHLNDLYKNRLNAHSLVQKAKEIKEGLETGKHNREKLIGFWSTWDENPANAVALLNIRFAIDKSVPTRDIIVKVNELYKKLEKQEFEDDIAKIFAAKYLDDIIKGELNEDQLIETAKKLCEAAEEYSKLEWDSEDAGKLMICYSGKVAQGDFSIDKLVETASELYEQAKKKNKAINKAKWSGDTAVEISVSHSGRVIEKGIGIENLVKELNESYKFFESVLPATEGWIFKSNEDLSKSATLTYTVVNHLGLKSEDIENEIVTDVINKQIEDEITHNMVLMNMIMTIMIMNMTTSIAASSSH